MADNQELRQLGDALDVAIVGEGARFWGVLERLQRKFTPNATRPAMAGHVGGLAVQVLWSVVARELTRNPALFMPTVQAFSGSLIEAVGANLAVLPFPMRLQAYQVLIQVLAQAMGIGLVASEEEPAHAEG